MHVPVELRWNDLDAYGHVNNAAMLVLLEEARISAFWRSDPGGGPAIGATTAVLDGSVGAATLTLVARQEIEYLAPVPYRRLPLDVEMWLGHLGGASLTVCYEVFAPAGVEPRTLHARAQTTIVLVDAASQRPRRITDEERAAWTPHLDAPIAFTRR